MLALIVITGLSCGFYIYVLKHWWKEAMVLKKSRTRVTAAVYASAGPNLTIVPEQRWLGTELSHGGRRAAGSCEVIAMNDAKVRGQRSRVVA